MPELDLDTLRDVVAGARIAVVVAERGGPREPIAAYALDLDQAITADFRDRAVATLADYADGLLPIPFEENTQLADHELGVADIELLDPTLVGELRRAARAQPDRDHEARPGRLRLYAVAATTDAHLGLLIRAQNPVRHLRPDHLTFRFLGGRLTRADPLFVYDAAFDLVVLDDVVGIRSQSALEALFMDPEVRDRDTETALGSVAPFIREIDHAELLGAATRDSRYSAKLRRMFRSGVFAAVDMAAIAQTIDEFYLELRVVNGRLAFPRTRSARWELVYALEDAYVTGRATGRRYQAPSKRAWVRRSIDRVSVVDGRVIEVSGPGNWSPRSAAAVIEDLRAQRPIEYVARLDDGPALVEAHPVGVGAELWIRGDTPITNRLLELADPKIVP